MSLPNHLKSPGSIFTYLLVPSWTGLIFRVVDCHKGYNCRHQASRENLQQTYEPHHEKTGFLPMRKKMQISCAVTAQLISAFVFTTRIVQSHFYLYPKFQASSHFCDCTGRFVSDLVRNPRRPIFLRLGSYEPHLMLL